MDYTERDIKNLIDDLMERSEKKSLSVANRSLMCTAADVISKLHNCNEEKYDVSNVNYHIVADASPSENPITSVVVKDEEICNVRKNGNWEIKRVFVDYYLPCEEVVIVFKKKTGESNATD